MGANEARKEAVWREEVFGPDSEWERCRSFVEDADLHDDWYAKWRSKYADLDGEAAQEEEAPEEVPAVRGKAPVRRAVIIERRRPTPRYTPHLEPQEEWRQEKAHPSGQERARSEGREISRPSVQERVRSDGRARPRPSFRDEVRTEAEVRPPVDASGRERPERSERESPESAVQRPLPPLRRQPPAVKWATRLGVSSIPLLFAAGLGVIVALAALSLGPKALQALEGRAEDAHERSLVQTGMICAVVTLVLGGLVFALLGAALLFWPGY